MNPIMLVKSTFYHEDETKKVLCDFITQSKQLSMGTKCREFEETFAKWQGKKYCVLFNSGSSANLALIQAALNSNLLKPKDTVAFSGITWATNVMPLIQLGLKPYPIDVEIQTLNCSSSILKKAYEKKPFQALFLTNLLGLADDITNIKKFCKKNGILLFEDNCESLGSVSNGIKLGSYGFASTFSFFVGHHMSTIEGGAICTDNEEFTKQLKMGRAHGWDRQLKKAEQKSLRKKYRVSDFFAKYTFYDLAYNLRPTEITGFLGLNQMQYLDEIIRKREENFFALQEIYDNDQEFYPLKVKLDTISSFAIPVICKNKKVLEKYVTLCDKNKIEVRPIVGGMMSTQPFYKKYIKEKFDLPNSEIINNYGFYFGNNPELTTEEIKYILSIFKNNK
ncbi:hypothetical protein A2X44_01250 [candidate division CPR3 bacterium GWF2_35_18]|uniref:DegT/DnrJ/EryC1/StrS aminotransferase n=1 Tax=candidate division CPR3 bacterium GW2011_GWF2_35_18 TaxID=1618350 RepID=A0A0G0E4Q0_UNCC3|nr:MAG: DegT/DnrJ/EryC1/StrS aminotransferase [candidate division CPR3 bacterium GW2011_GWF2_35_18]OGB63528.1 MAG: hypothetical protein A2X44_01250 [candidate division CPR3 bacterium GWF2_35_18]OGB64637.1 MAG: hypothetical protein A2250_03800 [candidate division CPR3 bacterium RIFOXYA2_FULL_35_13]OGB78451.1 MAG: hypothetical protein A2296_04950 [candidate division CPR3 bacterium RIFOXYB2_FULL_35_8]